MVFYAGLMTGLFIGALAVIGICYCIGYVMAEEEKRRNKRRTNPKDQP